MATFVAILGLERARAQAGLLGEQAKRHLDFFDDKTEPLRQMADFIVSRRS